MAADLVSIQDCNSRLIVVLFDANVLIDAMKQKGKVADLVRLVDPKLRHVASPTRYEVAFAHKGLAIDTLEENDNWISEHLIKRLVSREVAWGDSFDRIVDKHARTLRGKADLGDALLVASALELKRKGLDVAIATRNRKDFDELPVALVADFF